MKAAVLYGKEDIRYEDIQTPRLIPGNVKVRVKFCGICGSDIPRFFEGKTHIFPLILGHEFSGVIDDVAEDVEDINKGDHVVVSPLLPCFNCSYCNSGRYSLCKKYKFLGSSCFGGMSEFVVVPRKNVVVISKNIPFENAAFFEVATVSLHALRLLQFEGGYDVLVLGTGTVGLMIIQWAKLLGARRIIAIGKNVKSFNLAKMLGADIVLDINAKDFDAKFDYCCKNYSFKFVFEAVGVNETFKMAYIAVMRGGKVCLVGTPKKEIRFSVKEWELINRKEITLIGSWMGYSAPFPGNEWDLTREYMGNNKLIIPNSMIHKIFNLSDTSSAFKVFKSESVVGRILIKC